MFGEDTADWIAVGPGYRRCPTWPFPLTRTCPIILLMRSNEFSHLERPPPSRGTMRAVSIFTGVGGLDLGVANAGFTHALALDHDKQAIETLEKNKTCVPNIADWPIEFADANSFGFAGCVDGEVDLLTAGVSCQPFSAGGKKLGSLDSRNVIPAFVRAVRELSPRAIIAENVKGIVSRRLRPYFDYLLLQLTHAFLKPEDGEPWERHGIRLNQLGPTPTMSGLSYDVSAHVVNTADYGIPQRRERVFIVAFRSDLDLTWRMIEPTHSRDALLVSKYVDGSYWEEHSVVPQEPSPRESLRVKKLEQRPFVGSQRWRTVRDALADLPSPSERSCFSQHQRIPGARSYKGHTGSPWDEPAKTIKAGTHGVAGGENMIRNDDGTVRYFTIRELARLQTFPDEFTFSSTRSIATRQLGNAVPVAFAEQLAQRVKCCLYQSQSLP